MRKLHIFTAGLFIFISILPLKAQDLISNSAITSVCYAGNTVNRMYIPPPDDFFKKTDKARASVKFYSTGFTPKAEEALNKAAAILSWMLPPDVNITIVADWVKISTAGVLANSRVTGYIGGMSIDAQNPLAVYPVALAEKIIGKSLNEDLQGDIVINVNSSMNWYLGTDGVTPANMYDLVTVVLHEVIHGLGFYDSMTTEGALGSYGFSAILPGNDTVTIPLIYDTFIENFSGERLTDTLKFANNSTALKSQYTDGELYFKGPVLSKYTTGGRAKLWAPPVFDPGSSIAHLDEYQTAKENFLMTPSISLGEAIHYPGLYTYSIMGDLGWINTRIVHQPLGDTEKNLPDIFLSTKIESDTSFNRNKVGVVFSYDNFHSSDTLFMTSPESNDVFVATVSIPSYNTELQYYFFVEDYFLRLYKSPSLNEIFRYKVYIGADTVKPVISHTQKDYYLETIDSIGFEATATDNIAIDSVYVEYSVNTGPLKHVGLIAGKSDSFSVIFNAKPELLNGGDSIRYRIFAVDSTLAHNIAFLPDKGYFVIHIEDISTTVESYATDFTGAAPDFFNIGFDISKPAGFSKFGLHTKHPYESPEDNNSSIEYTSILRHPVKFNESGMLINFYEIVLVEPGELGSVFGSEDFYDYVIVEGSNNFGKTWFSLADGYDSRIVTSWESSYNNSIVGGNSTIIGSESMLRKHTIFYRPSAKISAGDTLLLRFRLYSDPFAYGWGWVIEDLKINPLIDAVEKLNIDPVIIYPNPGNGQLTISTDKGSYESRKPLRFSVFNSSGICIIKDHISADSETLVDISGYPNGIYIILLYRDDGIKTFKYSLIK